jgi:hypothetical protein
MRYPVAPHRMYAFFKEANWTLLKCKAQYTSFWNLIDQNEKAEVAVVRAQGHRQGNRWGWFWVSNLEFTYGDRRSLQYWEHLNEAEVKSKLHKKARLHIKVRRVGVDWKQRRRNKKRSTKSSKKSSRVDVLSRNGQFISHQV